MISKDHLLEGLYDFKFLIVSHHLATFNEQFPSGKRDIIYFNILQSVT